jgi:hypothetical protein
VFDRSARTFERADRTFERENRTFEREDWTFEREDWTFEREDRTFEREDRTFERENRTFEREDRTFEREDRTFERAIETLRCMQISLGKYATRLRLQPRWKSRGVGSDTTGRSCSLRAKRHAQCPRKQHHRRARRLLEVARPMLVADDAHCVRITLSTTADGDMLVVARCARCGIDASRLIDETAHRVATMVGAEALLKQGCLHVEAVALLRRKTMV